MEGRRLMTHPFHFFWEDLIKKEWIDNLNTLENYYKFNQQWGITHFEDLEAFDIDIIFHDLDTRHSLYLLEEKKKEIPKEIEEFFNELRKDERENFYLLDKWIEY